MLEAEHEQMLGAAKASLSTSSQANDSEQAIPKASDGVGEGDTRDEPFAGAEPGTAMTAKASVALPGSGIASFGRFSASRPAGRRAEQEATK